MKKYVNHDYKHLVGKDYPLYGIKTRVPKNKNPKFNRMSQLAALVALEIVNEGDGKANGEANIEIRNVSYEVKNENIVGGFKVDITGDEPSFENGTSPANKTTVTIVDDSDKDSFISIAPGDSAKIYFAVKPHDASGKSVTITVNGSSRTITMPANTKFKMGQATTIRVPVKLSHPKESDAVTHTSFLDMSQAESTKLTINGETVDGYIIGDGSKKSIIVYGTAKDMINALDVGFYASVWKDRKGAMTLNNLDMELMYNGQLTQLAKYKPLEDALVAEVKDDFASLGGFFGGIATGAAVGLVMNSLKNGIPRDKEEDLTFLYLTKFIAAETITFSKNIVENGASSKSDNIIILDEEPIHKQISQSVVNSFLETRFKYIEPQSKAVYIPTYQGLFDIVNNRSSSYDEKNKNGNTYRHNTSYAIYNKLMDKLGSKTISVSQSGMTVDIVLGNVLGAFFKTQEEMEAMFQTMKVKLDVSTYPYDANSTEYNPLILWGFDVYGPDRSTSLVAE